ncbi:hypothetical protein LTR08_001986 [Meristemomyces frigidus]|nr:hypothetical protein LTR08_001986 [Meristemomyces frigidus]
MANALQQAMDSVQPALQSAMNSVQPVLNQLTGAAQTTNTKPSQPIKLYSHAGGPNPWKVAIILNELQLPYTTEIMDFGDLKKEPFESVNPNGRVPAIEDPNTGLTLWESGAIIEYLLETYDKSGTLSYLTGKEKWEAKCWLHFQTSGQGPYYGQRAWFMLYHPAKIDSCLDRYAAEIRRVLGVINAHLKKNGNQQFLVGDKCTYADLAMVPWHWLLLQKPFIMGEEFGAEWKREWPEAWAWNERLQARPAVVKAREARADAMGKR